MGGPGDRESRCPMAEAAQRQALVRCSDFHYFIRMEKTITATEANRRFSRILREVEAGDSFTVTSHGSPVARIAPLPGVRKGHDTTSLIAFVDTLPHRVAGEWTRDDLYE